MIPYMDMLYMRPGDISLVEYPRTIQMYDPMNDVVYSRNVPLPTSYPVHIIQRYEGINMKSVMLVADVMLGTGLAYPFDITADMRE